MRPPKRSTHFQGSYAYSSCVSNPSGPPLFAVLPAELCLIILTSAAEFGQTVDAKNPYSSALALCRVSRTVRRIVLPELLHTILLSESKNVSAFMHALKMQKAYAQKGNHLHFDYATYVRRMWIGETRSLRRTSINFRLLAPVLFAPKSLALEIGNMFILDRCLRQVWDHRCISIEPFHHDRRFPWSTTTLTLAGDLQLYCPPTRYAVETLRSTFFWSMDQFIVLPPTTFNLQESLVAGPYKYKSYRYQLPAPEADKFPWCSVKRPQVSTISALPRVTLRWLGSDLSRIWEGGHLHPGLVDVNVRLRKISGRKKRKKKKTPSTGEKDPSFNIPAAWSFSGDETTVTGHVHWEQTWACRISP